MYRYRKGVTTGPPMRLEWRDGDKAIIDFSTGYTFSATIVNERIDKLDLLATKSTGITGYSTAAATTQGYNIMLDWVTADFTSLPASAIPTLYTVNVFAIPTVGDPLEFPGRAEFLLDAAAT